ncbi:inorganic phosphate transporter [Candidatus Fermentibacteria bacterium]|nr:inorganic phosphate transporter [Candidatus Fermentibacteria bacterium]
MITVLLGGTVALGLYLAWTIGGNDFANSMGDAVGARAVSIPKAILLGALCELAGSTLAGSHVTDTVRKGIVDPNHFAGAPELVALGMMAALLGTALWLHVATLFGLPVSTTHSIVGGVAGFGVVGAGWAAVSWGTLSAIVMSWFISPLVGGILAYILFKLIVRFILGQSRPVDAAIRCAPSVIFVVVAVLVYSTMFKALGKKLAGTALEATGPPAVILSVGLGIVAALIARPMLAYRLRGRQNQPLSMQLSSIEAAFAPLVVITSCSVAFAHGANDVANAIGPVAAVMDIIQSGTVSMKAMVPYWLLGLGGIGIALGLATYGYRVMLTIGTKITQLTPTRGVAADLAASTTVISCTLLKFPVSTTHTIVGAIIGVGFARGLGAVNRKVTRDIFGSWLITVPAAGLLSAVLFTAGRALGLADLIRTSFP